MKRKLALGLGILAAAAAVPVMTSTPVFAELAKAGEAIVQNIVQPKVKLVLSAQKKVIMTDAQGKEMVAWEDLKGAATVEPGDVLRYVLSSENAGDKPAESLVLTQPVPNQTQYVIGSAKANGAQLSYSIDGGSSFSAQPMVEVTLPDGTVEMQPAPAEMYSHVRWDYSESLEPMASVRAVFEVAVK
ncbi:DUF11 domain-containing protein [Lyngbya confervoides]|uniref:DUF11 domain-containing protein n=1 Tax=Lyngbya confervoides BDU141951 TaxID=1574623 RepID=A0ABD4T608_9CYAN|nr:DUF11 domain-containing protein [Lyngbya confervoides]MCM1983680.1 DUF11 domain-containing protein [Lyngbya confervoides BDU141951]